MGTGIDVATAKERRFGLLAILATATVFAYLAQGPSSPALSHFALVQSLARGTPYIDETRDETGSQKTHDFSWFEGHYYSNKAPGMALLTLPAYVVLDRSGLADRGGPEKMLWVLGLIGATVPAVLLLLLVRHVGNRIEPTFGTAAAVTLGLGTLLATYGTVFFPHALSALLVFAAFTLLFLERRADARLALVAGAGIVAGYAITTEYHNSFAVAILGLYAVARADWFRRGLAYSAGALAGVMPLVLYNWWAYGSVMHLSYEDTVRIEGQSGHDVLFGPADSLGLPDIDTIASLLLGRWGLVTTAPVLALGIVGAVILYRRGARAETLVIAAVVVAYLLFSASYYWPFGLVPPGPRFLVPTLPFLALPLAIAFRAFPLPSAALGAVSVAVASTLAVTRPHIAWDGHVLYRLVHPSWWSPTVADLVGIGGWYRVLPLIAALLTAVTLAALATLRRTSLDLGA